MSKEIVVNVGERETRIAVQESGRLVELHVEREERVVGCLYKGRVSNVKAGIDAAFIDIGLERNAFLQVGDVLPVNETTGSNGDHADSQEHEAADGDEEFEAGDEMEDDDGEKPGDRPAAIAPRVPRRNTRRSSLRHQKIADILKVGQEILVQVTKGPLGTKGARCSTRISLPGRYLVLMPEADNVGISRRIEEPKERDRLKKIGTKLRQDGFGIIIRTEAEDKSETELKADHDFLVKLWRQINENYKKQRAPSQVHQDLTLVYKTIRDVFGSDVDRLVIDDPAEYERANDLLDMVSPKLRGRIHLYSGAAPIFDQFGIESEMEKLLKRKVWLKSGGYLIFDETEALTVVDVNSGKSTGAGSLAETILRTNTDAATEIARQLRLRDIGGIIVIDFIDMNNPRDKQQVIKALDTALKNDRSRTRISSISALGLVEMTRKRTGETLTAFLTEPCAYCGGRGRMPSAASVSIEAERELQRAAAAEKQPGQALRITCHPAVAEILIGPDGETIDRIEREIRRAVFVRADPLMHPEKMDIEKGDIAQFDGPLSGIARTKIVECRIAESALDPENLVVGWSAGCLVSLNDGRKHVGQAVPVRITDRRRSYATAVIEAN